MTELRTLRLDRFQEVYMAVNDLNPKTSTDRAMGARMNSYRSRLKSAEAHEFDWTEFAWGTQCYQDEKFVQYVNETELGWDISLVPDLNQYRNDDLPDNLTFKDMGLAVRDNLHLDYQPMNNRDFRERCVQMNGKNYALYMKGKTDAGIKPANHKSQEVIQDIFAELEIECSDQTADDLAIMARKFNLDRKSMMKLIYGYVDQTKIEAIRDEAYNKFDRENRFRTRDLHEFNLFVGECADFCESLAKELCDHAIRTGLQSLDYIDLEDYADYFKDMSCRLPTISDIGDPYPRKLDDERLFYYDLYQRLIENGQKSDNPIEMMKFIEQSAADAFYNPDDKPNEADEAMMIELGFNIEDLELRYESLDDEGQAYVEESDDLTPASKYEDQDYDQIDGSVFSAFPLFHGQDNLNYEFIAEIKSADHNELKQIRGMAFEQIDHYTGRKYKAQLRHLTPAQMAAFWDYIRDRKAKLGREGLKNLTHNSRVVLGHMRKMGPYPQTKAMLKSYESGTDFETDTDYLEFSEIAQPSAEDIFTLWTQFNAMEV